MWKKMFGYLWVLIFVGLTLAVDLDYTEITVVTEETRYRTQHPEAVLTALNKAHHVKGNYLFSVGERISGDRIIVTFSDKIQFTKSEDIEVYIKYPAVGQDGATITAIEILADVTSDDADVFMIDGGIDHTYAEMLLACNSTSQYIYELYMYGY